MGAKSAIAIQLLSLVLVSVAMGAVQAVTYNKLADQQVFDPKHLALATLAGSGAALGVSLVMAIPLGLSMQPGK